MHCGTRLFNILFYSCFAGPVTDFKSLLQQAHRRMQFAFTEGTNKNHRTQISVYLQFCRLMNVEPLSPSVDTLLAFIEYLASHLTAHRSVSNYLSGVSFLHKALGSPFHARDSFQVSILLRAVKLTWLEPAPRPHVTLDQLRQLVSFAKTLGPQGLILAVVLTFGYFGFFRQSNLAPEKPSKFNKNKHTTRDHVQFAPPGLVVSLPWTKTRQNTAEPLVVPLPAIPQDKLICPVYNYQRLLQLSTTFTSDQPLLSLLHKPIFTIQL